MTDFATLIRVLFEADVEFIIVGGVGNRTWIGSPYTGPIKIEAGGVECLCLSLNRLIEVKRPRAAPKTSKPSQNSSEFNKRVSNESFCVNPSP